MKRTFGILVLFFLLSCLAISLPSCISDRNRSALIVENELLMEKFTTSWKNEEGSILVPLYSEDTIGFDAQQPGWSYNKAYVEKMAGSAAYWDNIESVAGPCTYFASQDGGHLALVAPVAYGGNAARPMVSVYSAKKGQFYFLYDYYGGAMSETFPLQTFEKRLLDPASEEARSAARKASATVKKWHDSYNSRDVEEYLSCFAENAISIDVVSPDWRVMTKSELAEETARTFLRSTFNSKLEASEKSPIPDGWFVSSDGRYAAAQGTYGDTEKLNPVPMLVFLELEGGMIVKQYKYMMIERNLLLD